MEYYSENQEIIAAEIEKKRLEQEYELLRTIAECRRKKVEWQRKVTQKFDKTELNLDYIEPTSRIMR